MHRAHRCLLALALLLPTAAGATQDERFPRPASLEPAVGFWTRVFAEADTAGGFLHDRENLGVVYEQLRLPVDRRGAERQIEARKRYWAGVLRRLAANPSAPQDAQARRVRALWSNAGPQTLRAAAGRIRFQRGQADKFRAGLQRSGAWEAYIHQVFAARGLPTELGALPHVESSFNPAAGSHVGAAGLWQFMSGTGRRFLRVDALVDERLDPFRATEAAARLLEENYGYVGTWPLALTAYNHGRGGVQRAVRTTGTTDIGRIIAQYRGPYFGFASRNFYPSFLAALDLSRAPEAHFGAVPRDPPADLHAVAVPAYLSVRELERALGLPRTEIQRYNPALRAEVWSGSKLVPAGYTLRVPRAQVPDAPQVVLAAAERAGRRAQIPDRTHLVRRGDTFSTIARRYGTTTAKLMAANGIRDARRLRAGSTLRLPGAPADVSGPVRLALAAPAKSAAPPPAEQVLAAASKPAATQPEGDAAQVIQPGAAVLTASLIPSLDLTGAQQPDRTTADEPDLAVGADGMLHVQPEENLALYAHWSGQPVERLRAHAGLQARTALRIGQRLRLDLSEVTAAEVEKRRRAHHGALRTAFLERHTVTDTVRHRVRRGESLWSLCQSRYGVPLWLVRAYNPGLDPAALKPGATLDIPRLKPRA